MHRTRTKAANRVRTFRQTSARRRLEAVLWTIRRGRAPAEGVLPGGGALLDFSTLRDVGGEWVQDGARRRTDSVWRVRYKDGTDRSRMVFLEFQSKVDAGMARRVLRNVGMAYERARRFTTEHLPGRNLVSTLFELNGVAVVADAVSPLRALGWWLPGLGGHAGPVRAAYAEWLSTTMPTLFPGETAAELVDRLTQDATEEDAMTVTVLEDRIQHQLRRASREGVARGMETVLGEWRAQLTDRATRKFDAETGSRVARELAGMQMPALRKAGEWIEDSKDAAELQGRLGNGRT